MIEVLEHIAEPRELLAEVFRVARTTVILTVPNNTQTFAAPVEWAHMLEVDHKAFFTVGSLTALLAQYCRRLDIRQVAPIDRALAQDLLPRWPFLVYRALTRFRVLRNRHYFRLIATAHK